MENNKPRDFFMHVATFAALYFIAIALITLLFTLIDYRLPDTLSNFFTDPYSGPVRFAIASLIILSPLFVWLMKRLQEDVRTNSERAKLSVRKWLTYITLFIAGFTAVGDLITLLYSFLGGSLPAAFALKALTLLTVAGAIFGYFFLDLKGFWNTHRTESWYAAYGFIALVVSSVLLGFAVLGSPITQRELRFDEERRASLDQIQSQVVGYWQSNAKLPEKIDDLNNPLQYLTLPTDPETGAGYEYKKTGNLSFEVCATFARASSITQKGEFYPSMPGLVGANNWKHDAGHICFARSINTDLTKPTQLPPRQVMIN